MTPTEIGAVLENCCRDRTPVALLTLDSNEIYQARFDTLAADCVALRLVRGDCTKLRDSSKCVCVFFRDLSGHAFLASVLAFHDEDRPTKLMVELPVEIAREGRSTLRIPVYDESGLIVQLASDENQSLRPLVRDISLAGIQLAFPSNAIPNLPVDSRVGLKISMDQDSAEMSGMIRWQKEGVCGIAFAGTSGETTFEPPASLVRIVDRLEREWFDRDSP